MGGGVKEGKGEASRPFLQKRTKKLLALARPTALAPRRPQPQPLQMKSFLLLFFKKEALPSSPSFKLP
jgi:hypothetical protein